MRRLTAFLLPLHHRLSPRPILMQFKVMCNSNAQIAAILREHFEGGSNTLRDWLQSHYDDLKDLDGANQA